MTYDDFDGVEPTTPLELALGHLRTLPESTELLINSALADDPSFMCAQILAIELNVARRKLAGIDVIDGELAARSSSPEGRRQGREDWRSRRGA